MYQVLIVLASVCALACGLGINLPAAPKDDRIVAGANADCQEFPFVGSIELDGKHICGGSVISEKHVLTHGSCVDGVDKNSLKIRVGTSTLGEGGTLHSVSDIIISEDNIPSFKEHSIALLEAGNPFVLDEVTVQAIDLARVDPSAGVLCTIIGWGSTSFGSQEPSRQLQSGNVRVMDNNVCRLLNENNESDGIICTGIGVTDACRGDTGGPLVCNGIHSGVVSSRLGCGNLLQPTYYASTANQDAWIDSIINRNK